MYTNRGEREIICGMADVEPAEGKLDLGSGRLAHEQVQLAKLFPMWRFKGSLSSIIS